VGGTRKAVVRDAGPEDLPVVAACLASAFYEDPLWGHWTFPDESSRERDLLPFMTLQAQLGVAHGRIAMTACLSAREP
jgi:hypothetical protein